MSNRQMAPAKYDCKKGNKGWATTIENRYTTMELFLNELLATGNIDKCAGNIRGLSR